MIVTALFTSILFLVIYYVVATTVYNHLDADLEAELEEVSHSIVFLDNKLIFTNEFEWGEREHGQIEVNPTFIQVVDSSGNNIRKTGNLMNDNLSFHPRLLNKQYFDLQFSGSSIRQVQLPLISDDNQLYGYLIVAVPLEESAIVLSNLKSVLIISFPLMLLLLFSVSRIIAGRIISPIKNIITTSDLITRENLNKRIPLPGTKDELYKLSDTINNLLNRLEDAILREKQFTADASHELRTPLSVIKGTLEVLIRKEREPEQYKEKVKYVISEVDRMTLLVEQLLSLARLECGKVNPAKTDINLSHIIRTVTDRFLSQIEEKNISIRDGVNEKHKIKADASMMEIIFENLISNSIKYSDTNGIVSINTREENQNIIFSINNTGQTIPTDKLNSLFDRFYRVDESRASDISGNGLGLAIVKRLIDLQNFIISVKSSPADGTTFQITFN